MAAAVPTRGIAHLFRGSRLRYAFIVVSSLMLLSPLLLVPRWFGNDDLCGGLCMRRFFLLFPGMEWQDIRHQIGIAAVGAGALLTILVVTFFFGRLWCSYLCPMGGLPELFSRLLHDRWKIDYRALPQVPIRYGYFLTYVILLPAVGFSACTLCNFITIPRLMEALGGGARGIAWLVSTIGAVNLSLVILLGFVARLGRGYCQFLCPIGAIDGVVNRLGARLPFVRRTMVERSRCTGCRKCAEVCIVGAIRMENRIAVVDQLSCMSCRECVIACEWGAIEWLHPPRHRHPVRIKKGIEIHPLPVWTAVAKREERTSPPPRPRRRPSVFRLLLLAGLLLAAVPPAAGAPRETDPDGCLACHAIEGLAWRDDQGVLRDASIDADYYAASLHGNVPCSDCHRRIRHYPHEEENGAVDCAASCHLEEPSEGEAYTHRPVVREMRESIHADGRTEGFTGGNRIDDDRNDRPPSCRRCHRNTPYIPEERMPLFREAFRHHDEACGDCHQGDAWRSRMSGHILRRLLGARWTKQEETAMCNGCHRDREAMAAVERGEGADHRPRPVTARFILAGESYDATLHGRLLASGRDGGASCNDCHAPGGFRHAIRPADDPDSAVHDERLATTCGAAGCHRYADHPLNGGFLRTEMHDADLVPPWPGINPVTARLDSNWVRASLVLVPSAAGFLLIALVWSLRVRLLSGRKRPDLPILGGIRFEIRMLNRRPRRNNGNGRKR